MHRRNLLFLGLDLTLMQTQFRMVSTVPRNGFKRLIVQWPELLLDDEWDRLRTLAESGVEILLFGPPGGAGFAKFCGIHPVDRDSFIRVQEGHAIEHAGRAFPLAPQKFTPNYRSNRRYTYPNHFKVFTVRPRHGTEVIAHAGSQPVAVRRGNISYFGCELAHYHGLMKSLWPANRFPRNLMVFSYRRGNERLLAGVGRWSRPVSGKVVWENFRLQLDGCNVFVARHDKQGKGRVLVGEGIRTSCPEERFVIATGCRPSGNRALSTMLTNCYQRDQMMAKGILLPTRK